MANKIEVQAVLRDQLSAGMGKLGAATNAVTSGLSGLLPVAGGVAGVLAAVASAAVANTLRMADMAEQLGKLRTATGLSYRELQALQRALIDAGTAPEALNTATRILSVNIAQGDKTLKRYGITAKDTYGAINQVGQRLAQLAQPAQKAELAMAAFGRSSQDMIDTISRFATDEKFRASMEAIGLSDAGVERLQKVDEAMDGLKDSWAKLGNTFAEMAAGPTAKGISALTRLLEIASVVNPISLAKKGLSGIGDRLSSSFAYSPYAAMAMGFMGGGGGGAGGGSGGGASGGGSLVIPPAGSATGSARFSLNPAAFGLTSATQRNTPVGGSSGYQRLLAASVSGTVAQPMNAHEQYLARTERRLASFGASVSYGFENMFNSVFQIQRRSKNVIVALFQDIFNSIVSSLSQSAASSIGSWVVSIGKMALGIPSIPGAGMTAGGGGTSQTIVVNTLTSDSLVGAMIGPSGALRGSNAIVRQMAAVR